MTTEPSTPVSVEFWCDLVCSESNALLDDVEQLRTRVEVRIRHFPMVAHTWAVPAAQVAEEGRSQGVYWSVAVAILNSFDEVHGVEDLVRLAAHGGADSTQVRRALMDGRHAGAVARDYRLGRDLGLTRAPSLIVHGHARPARLDAFGRRHDVLIEVETMLESLT